ncbi:MAG: hypothetical protein QME93_11405 [Bacillota bacterium]|nr:hypothetical protein [Bacillota bacterium]
MSLDPNPYLLEREVHLSGTALPTGQRWEVVVRSRAEIPPDFLEPVADIGRAYGRITTAGHPARPVKARPRTGGPDHLVLFVFGRKTLEHLLAAVRRALPGGSVTTRRWP